MKAVVIGCGRVGSASAKALQAEGWDVCAVDEKEEALQRLGENWTGGFVVGHGMDSEVLREAGIEDADAVIVATDGDNTNLVVAQIAQKRFGVANVVVRVLDPGRATFYDTLGLRTICPTSRAIRALIEAVHDVRGGAGLMYIIVVGGGKVGANLMRSLIAMGHEVTLIEQRRDRFERLEQEFEHRVQPGDATELFVLEQAGITRPPDILVAATGDDEDNIIICQLAREKYGVPKVVARVNDPRNQEHFDLLGIAPTVCATSSLLALVEHEVPEHGLVHLVELRKENLEIVEVQIDARSPCLGKALSRVQLPDGAQLIAVVRDGEAHLGDGELDARERRPGARPAPAGPGGRATPGVARTLVLALLLVGPAGRRRGRHGAPAAEHRPRRPRLRPARVRGGDAVGAGQALRRRAAGPDLRAREGEARACSSTSAAASAPTAPSRACSRWRFTRTTRRTAASTSTTPTRAATRASSSFARTGAERGSVRHGSCCS